MQGRHDKAGSHSCMRIRESEIVRMGVAHVMKGRGIFPKMTVAENLELGPYLERDQGKVTSLQ